MGFAAYWRWKSRSPVGRPRIAKEVRDLIRRMSLENPFWGATKIHGELRKVVGTQSSEPQTDHQCLDLARYLCDAFDWKRRDHRSDLLL